MSHMENEPQSALLVKQIEPIVEEGFRMAERIVERSLDRQDITEKSIRDHYFESVPMIADRISSQMVNIANIIRDGSSKDIDRIYETIEEVIAQMRRANSVK